LTDREPAAHYWADRVGISAFAKEGNKEGISLHISTGGRVEVMSTKTFPISVLLCLALLHSTLASAGTWYVNKAAAGPRDGQSFETGFETIQEGIDVAVHGDTVIAEQGTYYENIRFLGKNIVLRSTNPLDSAVVSNTVMDGNESGPVIAFSGTEEETCTLSGFTIRNGKASTGGGIDGGEWDKPTRATIRNNVIAGNWARTGGGLAHCHGLIRDNLISGNQGGGLAYCDGIIEKNKITGNSVQGGLFNCDGLIQNNLISGNSAAEAWGGGLGGCNGTIQNNLISGNAAWSGGGLSECEGTILNNTIVDNSGEEYNGGVGLCHGAIRNCIIWGNTAAGLESQVESSNTPSFSCVQGWDEGGVGNVNGEPLFIDSPRGNYRLEPDSPCVNAGVNGYWLHWPQRDMDGNCRLIGERVDMGCYEYGSSPDSDGDLLSDEEESSAGTAIDLDDTDGDGLRDGLEVLRGSDPKEPTPPGILHVPSDLSTVQEALGAAVDGDEIIVAAGTYRENVCFLGVDVILRSCEPGNVNIVASTILEADGATPVVSFVGSESEACVLAGFTLRNGSGYIGGGICGGSEDTHTHATIEGNTITGNSAWKGGGLAYCDGDIRRNQISGNSAKGYDPAGGGLYGCHGLIQGNLIHGNSAEYQGGGLCQCNGAIRSNVIAANSARGGGGLAYCEGVVENNTIYQNAATRGSGLDCCFGTIRNCVIWEVVPGDASLISQSSVPTYSCIQNWAGDGVGNISESPRFVDPDGQDDDPDTYQDNNYRLISKSPCIDAGDNSVLDPPGVDLDGNLRIAFGAHSLTVDMGAYELRSPPLKVSRLAPDENSGLWMIWNSQPNDTYTIWCCDDLLGGEWINRGGVSSAGTSTAWTDPDTVTVRRFYRIEMK